MSFVSDVKHLGLVRGPTSGWFEISAEERNGYIYIWQSSFQRMTMENLSGIVIFNCKLYLCVEPNFFLSSLVWKIGGRKKCNEFPGRQKLN